MTTKRQPLAEIAARIDAHLKRFEKDPNVNVPRDGGLQPYYLAHASAAGAFVSVSYVSFQGRHSLARDEALQYLAWLDAGGVGRHTAAGVNPLARRQEAARDRARTREQARIKAEEERAAKVVFEPVTVEEAENFVEGFRAGSYVWRLAKTVLMLRGAT